MTKKTVEPSLADLGLDEPILPAKAPAPTKVPPVRSLPLNDLGLAPYPEPKMPDSKPLANPPLTVPSVANPMIGLVFTGCFFLIFGMVQIILFGFMDTTIEEQINGVTQRIYNTGLQQEQLLGFHAGLAACLTGVLTLVIRTAAKAMTNSR